MKKIIWFTFCLLLGAPTYAQIEFIKDGTSTDYSGGVYSYYANDTLYHSIKFNVYNNTGSTQSWIASRHRIDPVAPTSWSDYMCWGLPVSPQNPFGGLCINDNQMDVTEFSMAASTASEFEPGEYGELFTYQKPSYDDIGTHVYRYYVGTPTNPFMDSVDVEVIMTPLTIDEQQNETAQVYPVPAGDFVHVEASSIENGTISVVNLTGQVIQNQHFSSKAKLNTATLEEGVYTIIIEAEGQNRIVKRIVVSH